MLYRGPMGGGAASGAMGAMVAGRNRGGQYLRARAKPSGVVASANQQIVRNALGELSTAWSDVLDDGQRLSWVEYAVQVNVTNRLGDSINLSGQNWYVACNTPRLQAGLDRIDDAPVVFNRGTLPIGEFTAGVAGSNLTIDFGGTVTADSTCLVYQGAPFSIGRNKYYGATRFVGTIGLGAGAVGGTLTPAYSLPGPSAKQIVRLVFTADDGRLSTPLDATFLGT